MLLLFWLEFLDSLSSNPNWIFAGNPELESESDRSDSIPSWIFRFSLLPSLLWIDQLSSSEIDLSNSDLLVGLLSLEVEVGSSAFIGNEGSDLNSDLISSDLLFSLSSLEVEVGSSAFIGEDGSEGCSGGLSLGLIRLDLLFEVSLEVEGASAFIGDDGSEGWSSSGEGGLLKDSGGDPSLLLSLSYVRILVIFPIRSKIRIR